MTDYFEKQEDGSIKYLGKDIYGKDDTDWGYTKRRIEALEREQSLLGKRVDALEALLRREAETKGSIPGDIGVKAPVGWDAEVGAWRMLPPEQEDDPR